MKLRKTISFPLNQPGASLQLKLSNERSVTVRSMRPTDAPLLEAMFGRLSSESRFRRFLIPLDNAEPELIKEGARRLATVDPARAVALITTVEEERQERAVAVARYARATPDAASAEGSIVVCDDYQKLHLGTQLVELLYHTARQQDIAQLTFYTQTDNDGVLALLRSFDIPHTTRFDQGLLLVEIQLRSA